MNLCKTSPISLFLMITNFETGGSEHQFTVLAKGFKPTRFQVHLGCSSRRGPLAKNFSGVPEFHLGGSLYGWTSLSARFNLGRHLRKHRIQIAQAFDFYTNLTLIPAARLAHIPVVIGSHRQLGDLMTPAQFWAQTVALRWCDAVVCNSKAAADRLATAGLSREKLSVIGNALPIEMFEPCPPALSRRSRALRLVMVSRMNAHYKNHLGFLDIAARVHQFMPDAEFVLAGDGPLRPDLERYAAAIGLKEHAFFLGDRRDIPAVLASTDLAVLTSNSESLSNAILEAMASGLPVVAYDVGGNNELVNEDRGALIEAGNEPKFVAAVCRLLSDSNLRARQGHNGRQFARENFSLDRVTLQYEHLYARLLDQKMRKISPSRATG